MIRSIWVLSTLVVLAACGADGAPERPPSGVTGEASFGVVLR